MYRWLKDGREIGDYTSEYYHRIQNTKKEDGGSYQCIAKNDVGSILSQKVDVSVACKLHLYIFLKFIFWKDGVDSTPRNLIPLFLKL